MKIVTGEESLDALDGGEEVGDFGEGEVREAFVWFVGAY